MSSAAQAEAETHADSVTQVVMDKVRLIKDNEVWVAHVPAIS